MKNLSLINTLDILMYCEKILKSSFVFVPNSWIVTNQKSKLVSWIKFKSVFLPVRQVVLFKPSQTFDIINIWFTEITNSSGL